MMEIAGALFVIFLGACADIIRAKLVGTKPQGGFMDALAGLTFFCFAAGSIRLVNHVTFLDPLIAWLTGIATNKPILEDLAAASYLRILIFTALLSGPSLAWQRLVIDHLGPANRYLLVIPPEFARMLRRLRLGRKD